MIIEEFKSESTIIRIDDRYIENEENSKELVEYVIGIILKKYQNTCK